MIKSFSKFIRNLILKNGMYIQRLDYFKLDAYRRNFEASSLKQKRFVNVGSGSFYHPYWTNVDLVTEHYGPQQKNVINFDLTKNSPMPFAESSLEVVYTSHTIEHVPYNSAVNLFKEARRCLKKGGILRVTTGPDADTDFRALKNHDHDWFYWDQKRENYGAMASENSIVHKWLNHVFTELNGYPFKLEEVKSEQQLLELINKHGYPEILNVLEEKTRFSKDNPHNHITWWNHDRLINAISSAGFNEVYRSGFWQSRCSIMRRTPQFDTTHPQISIYVEAIK